MGLMNFGKVFKVFDTVMSVIDATKEQPADPAKTGDRPSAPIPSFGDQIEMRLTNVVISALKEAFNRDEARLELERTHLEEQRRRAEETMRIELRKQAADRELGRLKLIGVAGLVGGAVNESFIEVEIFPFLLRLRKPVAENFRVLFF